MHERSNKSRRVHMFEISVIHAADTRNGMVFAHLKCQKYENHELVVVTMDFHCYCFIAVV